MSVSSKSRSHGKLHPSGHAQLSRHTDTSKRGWRGAGLHSDAASSVMSAYSQQTTSSSPKVNFKLENTYRTTPEVTFAKSVPNVTHVMRSVLESFLADCVYDPQRCAELSRDIATLIKKRVQELYLPRYKLICNVIIGQDTNQGLQLASRYLWNTDTDNFASVDYKNGDLFAVATLYAVYFE